MTALLGAVAMASGCGVWSLDVDGIPLMIQSQARAILESVIG